MSDPRGRASPAAKKGTSRAIAPTAAQEVEQLEVEVLVVGEVLGKEVG